MNENLMKYILMIRNISYLIIFIGALLIISWNYVFAYHKSVNYQECFWPPDLIPHPHPPGEPHDPKIPEIS